MNRNSIDILLYFEIYLFATGSKEEWKREGKGLRYSFSDLT